MEIIQNFSWHLSKQIINKCQYKFFENDLQKLTRQKFDTNKDYTLPDTGINSPSFLHTKLLRSFLEKDWFYHKILFNSLRPNISFNHTWNRKMYLTGCHSGFLHQRCMKMYNELYSHCVFQIQAPIMLSLKRISFCSDALSI